MDVRIKAIHFDATEKLEAFIAKKAERLQRHYPAITAFDATLKVVKPETAKNKEALIKITVPGTEEFVASKIADTFEEAVDKALEALEPRLERLKG